MTTSCSITVPVTAAASQRFDSTPMVKSESRLERGGDLSLRILEFIECVVDLFRQHVVLDGDHHLDEYVVLGLGLDRDVELLDPQVNAPNHRVDEGDLDVEARPRFP